MTTKLSNLRKYVETAKGCILESASYTVIHDLKEKGPYWSGTFERSWVGRAGNVFIPKNVPPPAEPPLEAMTKLVTPPSVTPYNGGTSVNNYTIGNQATYRALAQDLIPGRIKGGNNETAPANWYRSYLSGPFRDTLKATVTSVLKADPRITQNFS